MSSSSEPTLSRLCSTISNRCSTNTCGSRVIRLICRNISLVSRSAGTLRTRTVGSQATSVQASERGRRTQAQVFAGYLRKVRATYEDVLVRKSATVEVAGNFDGGKILEIDLSNVVSSATMARAIEVSTDWPQAGPAPPPSSHATVAAVPCCQCRSVRFNLIWCAPRSSMVWGTNLG